MAADIPLALALKAAQAAITACRADSYNVTVVVLDDDPKAQPRLVLRSDGARDMTVSISRRKAYTAMKTGMTSGQFGKTVAVAEAPPSGPPPGGEPKPPGPINGDPDLITWAGGVPIISGHNVLGAIAVSGAPGPEKDEACANAGLATIAREL